MLRNSAKTVPIHLCTVLNDADIKKCLSIKELPGGAKTILQLK